MGAGVERGRMSSDWQAAVAGERMELDREFGDRVDASSLDRQQWGLVMTALSFEIENPGDPDVARIRPDTSKVDAIVPELDDVSAMGPMPGSPPGNDDGRGGGGLIDRLAGALGFSDGEEDRREEIEQLASLYGERLEEKLRERGRWETVCERASA